MPPVRYSIRINIFSYLGRLIVQREHLPWPWPTGHMHPVRSRATRTTSVHCSMLRLDAHLPHLLLSSSYRVILFHLEREKYVFKFLYAIVNIIKIFLDNVKKDREYSIVYEIFIYKFEDEHFIVISEVKNNLIFNIFVNYMLRYNIIFIILIL